MLDADGRSRGGPGRASPNRAAWFPRISSRQPMELEHSRQGLPCACSAVTSSVTRLGNSGCLSGPGALRCRGKDAGERTLGVLQTLVRVCILSEGLAFRNPFEIMVPFESQRKAMDSFCGKCLWAHGFVFIDSGHSYLTKAPRFPSGETAHSWTRYRFKGC